MMHAFIFAVAVAAANPPTGYLGLQLPPLETLEAEQRRLAMTFDVPSVVGGEVAAMLGYSIQIPRHMAMLSPAQVVDIVRAIPAFVSLEAVHMLPGVGPAYVSSYPVNCADSEAYANAVVVASTGVITTPAVGKIADPFGRNQIAYTCQNATTTVVQVGDSMITDPDTARRGPIYCTTNCPEPSWGGNARMEYCRGATDVTIYCRALVSATSPP